MKGPWRMYLIFTWWSVLTANCLVHGHDFAWTTRFSWNNSFVFEHLTSKAVLPKLAEMQLSVWAAEQQLAKVHLVIKCHLIIRNKQPEENCVQHRGLFWTTCRCALFLLFRIYPVANKVQFPTPAASCPCWSWGSSGCCSAISPDTSQRALQRDTTVIFVVPPSVSQGWCKKAGLD